MMDPVIIKKESTPQWFVFYVMAKHERKVDELLQRDGYETYLPIHKVVKQWTHRKKTLDEPLFKSYIFVRIKESTIWDILQYPAVVKNIRFNNEPAFLPQKHIDLIKDMIAQKTQFELSSEKLKKGDFIKLKTGPFKGQEGIVKEIRGARKLLIFLEALGLSLVIEYN